MKKILFYFLNSSLALTTILFACKRQLSWNAVIKTINHIALAGPDVIITLPNGQLAPGWWGSSDPYGKISDWQWTKVSGPASFAMDSANAAKTVVTSNEV
jgi:hypothetical protein